MSTLTVYSTLLSLLLSVLLCTGHIEYLEIRNDARSAFAIESFGYEPNGKFMFELNDLMLLVLPDYPTQSDEYQYKLAFVLQRSNTDATLRLDQTTDSTMCFHEQFVDTSMGRYNI